MLERPTHVVVMGDLIGSERADSVEAIHSTFNDAIDAVNAEQRPTLSSPLTITLGDEFQGLCASLSDGVAIVRTLRQRLLSQGVPCRFVLGLVTLRTSINHDRAWNMMGPGLAQARDRLAVKREPNAYRFLLPDRPIVVELLDALGHALTAIEEDWTARQQEIVIALLAKDRTVAEIAHALRVTARNIYNVRKAGGFKLYQSLWQSLERAFHDLDIAYGFV